MHLPRGVLQQIAQRAVQNSWRAFRERRGVMLRVESLSGRLYSDELNGRIVNKSVEHPDRVRAAADAGDDSRRKRSGLGQHLLPRLTTDDRLKVPHHARVRCRTNHRADHVMGVDDGRDPVTNRLARRIL